jgi:hypothetical protein
MKYLILNSMVDIVSSFRMFYQLHGALHVAFARVNKTQHQFIGYVEINVGFCGKQRISEENEATYCKRIYP